MAAGPWTLLVCVVAVALSSIAHPALGSPTAVDQATLSPSTSLRRDLEDDALDPAGSALTTSSTEVQAVDYAVALKDSADVTKGHETKPKPIKIKKKKPMSKHKKKKQSFKDKLMPLLLIPFVIQTMLIPLFIMKLKLLTIKAMTVGKFAILLILFNMFRSWQRNAHSTSIRSTPGDSWLMAQNYGYNGGMEYGALFNGR